MGDKAPHVALPTVIGLGLLLMPLTTMWHEIGGHALACAAQGGQIAAIGAFYVECERLSGWPRILVALAGAGIDTLLAAAIYASWRRARGDLLRLTLWYVWVDKAFVAAGYLAFSGISGFGDLAPGDAGGLGAMPHAGLFRLVETVVGIALYAWLVVLAIRTLTGMLGGGPATLATRRRIAHGYYLTAGATAVLVGLANPVGLVIVLMSAAASSFGGLAGLVSVGFARTAGEPRAFMVKANWPLLVAGIAVAAGFALTLGPTWRP